MPGQSHFDILHGRRFGLIADAHVHPGKTPPLPGALGEVFKDCDAILALGDLGEASGLEALQKIAPVKGVLGGDDAHGDARISYPFRSFSVGPLTIGAVFDGEAHGLFQKKTPFRPHPDLSSLASLLFGRKIDVLACASTHRPLIAVSDGILIVDPGSPTLSDTPSVAVIEFGDGYVSAVEHRL